MVGDFFNFEWGKEGLEKARNFERQLAVKDELVGAAVTGVLFASVITARGRIVSPSSILEDLIKSKRRTNPFIIEKLAGAWNIMADQVNETSDRVDVLMTLITPRHRNRNGVSETLKYQLSQTYESFVDFWVTIADMMTGLRSVAVKVFAAGDTVTIADYLHRGMTRSELMAAFGHELPRAIIPEDESDESDNDESED